VQVLKRVLQEDPVRPRRHNPQIHADVETIVLKALSKEPERRYATAKEFAEDVERFLEGEPIRARPASAITKAARYLWRRPWAMATLTVALLAGAAGTGLLWDQARARARMAEAAERDRVRVTEARALVDEAARRLDDWDRFLYLPPRDLTPHRSLLHEAVELCDEALRRAALPAALQVKARALSRLGEDESAAAAVGEALGRLEDGGLYLERARIRLRRSVRRAMDAAQFVLPVVAAGTGPRGRKPAPPDAELMADLAAAHRLGHVADVERAVVSAIERTLRGEFDLAEKDCTVVLEGARPWQQAEIQQALAWGRYLRGDLPKARQWVTEALDVRRSDASLYLFRAVLDVEQAKRLWYAQMVARGGATEELRRTIESARQDARTVLRVTPGDPDARVLLSDVHLLTVPPEAWGESADIERLRATLAPAMRQAEQEIAEALAVAPNHVAAWVQLSTLRAYQAQIAMDPESKAVDRAVETCTKCLGLSLEPAVEAKVRAARAKVRAQRYLLRGLRGEADRRAAAEDVARLRELDPEEADEFGEPFRDVERPPK
jgi:serine/threonine-protein kinase